MAWPLLLGLRGSSGDIVANLSVLSVHDCLDRMRNRTSSGFSCLEYDAGVGLCSLMSNCTDVGRLCNPAANTTVFQAASQTALRSADADTCTSGVNVDSASTPPLNGSAIHGHIVASLADVVTPSACIEACAIHAAKSSDDACAYWTLFASNASCVLMSTWRGRSWLPGATSGNITLVWNNASSNAPAHANASTCSVKQAKTACGIQGATPGPVGFCDSCACRSPHGYVNATAVGCDYFGGDIMNRTGIADSNICGAWCEQVPACLFFTYVDGNCFLKSRNTGKRAVPPGRALHYLSGMAHRVSCQVNSTQALAPPNTSYSIENVSTTLHGSLYGSPNVCQTACIRSATCVVWSSVPAEVGSCTLFFAGATVVAIPNGGASGNVTDCSRLAD